MRRIAAVVLPSFRIELVRARARDLCAGQPLAVVITDASERALSGGTRIDDASSEARAFGVRPGATIASAKARCHDLRVRVLPPAEAANALRGLAEALLALGAITSPLVDRDAVLVDVTGCAHLVSNKGDGKGYGEGDGEDALVAAIARTVRAAGYGCHVAIASGPEIAWAIATGLRRSIAVAPHETSRVLGGLSVDVLRLEDSTASYLRRLGIRTLGQLRALPRASLASRVGEARATHVLALLGGQDDTPLVRYEVPEILSEHVALDWGTEHTEALFFLFKGLCDRLAARLQGRAAVATRLEVELALERLVPASEARAEDQRHLLSIPLASPVKTSEQMQSVLRARFEREPALPAPVVGVTVRAPDLASGTARSLHLFVPQSRAELALPALSAELSALLGEAAAGTLAAIDDWRPLERSRLVPLGQRRPSLRLHSTASLVGDAPEPIRVFDPPLESSPAEPLQTIARIARFEHVAWWRGDASESRAYDLVLAWAGGGGGAVVFAVAGHHGYARIRGVLD